MLWPWYWPEGSHNGLRLKAAGHYGCPKVNTMTMPLQSTINLFIIWVIGLTLNPGFNQANMGFTTPLWILLCHYGSAIMGCASPVIQHRPAWP